MISLFTELKRRNIIRVAVLYAVSGWLLLQVGDVPFGLPGVPDWSLRLPLGEIAATLGVRHVLEGNVRKAGGTGYVMNAGSNKSSRCMACRARVQPKRNPD